MLTFYIFQSTSWEGSQALPEQAEEEGTVESDPSQRVSVIFFSWKLCSTLKSPD